jgi:hypothetical protein
MRVDRRHFLGFGTVVATSAVTPLTANGVDGSGRVSPVRLAQTSSAPATPMIPICVALIPSSRRPLGPGQVIEFDQLYERAVVPAARNAGFRLIRAEQELGSIASEQALERLILADCVIADVSDEDADISYQLGIRQTLRPRGTALIAADFARRPFYAASPVITYRVDPNGTPANVDGLVNQLKGWLREASDSPANDSPVFSLIGDLPAYRPDPAKAVAFRGGVESLLRYEEVLDRAIRDGEGALITIVADPNFLSQAENNPELMVGLFIALRNAAAYKQMIELYDRMPLPLRRAPLVREQFALALDRTQRLEEAARTINEVVREEPTSRTYALLGRIQKDRWDEARKAGSAEANELLRAAIDAYLNGYQLDWRDAYPGINAVTLMEMGDRIDPRQSELLPVVRFATLEHARSRGDYWDYATLLELDVLAADRVAAKQRLSETTVRASEKWQLESTARNIKLIADKRRERSKGVDWIDEIIATLTEVEPGKKATP